MISSIVSRLVILVFGTLYPAYASYKAVRTKNVKEYVKWMMYWIVFALFTCAETFTDVFLSFWFPFYYEIKIILVLWLLSPATKGSSILYRKFVHPMLSRREQEIDEYIAKAKEQGYHTVLHLGTKGVNYATTVLMQTAIKGGGGLVNQLRRSYSLSDLSSDKDTDMARSKNIPDEDDMEETDGLDPRILRPRGYSPRRSASGSGRVEMYFPEVDVDVRQHGTSRPREPSIPLSHIRSSEDVSSGYSSAEPLYAGHHSTKSEGLAASREPLVRTASVGSTRSMRTKSSRGGVVTKRGPAAEDSDFFEMQSDEAVHIYQEDFVYAKSPPLSPPSIPNNVPTTQEQFVDASEEELPLLDAVTESQSNDFSLSESVTHDLSIEVPSSKDLTISASDSTTVPHPFTPSSEATKLTQKDAEPNQTNDVKYDNLKCPDTHTDKIQPAQPIHTASSTDSSLAEKQISVSAAEQPLVEKEALISSSLAGSQPLIEKDLVLSSSTGKQPLDEKEAPISSSLAGEQPLVEKESQISSSLAAEQSLVDKESPILSSLAGEQPLVEKESQISSSLAAEQSLVDKESPILSSAGEQPLVEKESQISSTSAEEQPLIEKDSPLSSCLTTEQALVKKEIPTSSSAKEQPLVERETLITSASTIAPSFAEKQSKPELFPAVEAPSVEKEAAVIKTSSAEAPYFDNVNHKQLSEQDTSSAEKIQNESLSTIQSPSASTSKEEENRVIENLPLIDGIENESISVTYPAEAASPLTVSSAETLSPDSTISEYINENEMQKLNESGSAYDSSESLALPQTPSRSNSQTSLRKEGRSGRYHKHPAPTPPPRTPEPDEGHSVTPTLDKKDTSEDTATGSDDSEAAITTARLVLKPGVVRSLGPDPNIKTEVFVSKSPQVKNKKSKSKQKQGDSSISRLFAIPKNQFGSLTSLIPFWPGKQEPSSSNSVQGRTSDQLRAPLADCE